MHMTQQSLSFGHSQVPLVGEAALTVAEAGSRPTIAVISGSNHVLPIALPANMIWFSVFN